MTHPIRFGIVSGQRASFAELSDRIVTTEQTGWDSFEVVDHFYGLFDVMEPTHEAYTMLAALAPQTSRVRLGVMVAGNTYRNPAFLLKQAMTVDEISNGRVTFGVGPDGPGASTKPMAGSSTIRKRESTASRKRWRSGICCRLRSGPLISASTTS